MTSVRSEASVVAVDSTDTQASIVRAYACKIACLFLGIAMVPVGLMITGADTIPLFIRYTQSVPYANVNFFGFVGRSTGMRPGDSHLIRTGLRLSQARLREYSFLPYSSAAWSAAGFCRYGKHLQPPGGPSFYMSVAAGNTL